MAYYKHGRLHQLLIKLHYKKEIHRQAHKTHEKKIYYEH